jgi:thiamine biosynthesis lipoprotein
MKKYIVLLAISVMILSGCTPSTTNTLNRYDQSTFEAGFDTVVRMIGYTKTKEEFEDYFNQLSGDFYTLHQLFDKYNAYEGINNIYTINQQAGISAVEVDRVVIDLLLMSKYWYENGNNLLDISFGAVLEVWHDYREAGMIENSNDKGGLIPTLEELKQADQCTGWDYVEIDEEKNTVYINDACASIDVGATAKGFAAEYVARKLEEKGLEHALISAGGNVRSINDKPDGTPWGVGIELPIMFSDQSADTLKIPFSISIVTSGDYQRNYQGIDGKSYHHLINPNTLFPETYFRSVSVVTNDSGIADALSTILFLMPYEEGTAFITQLQQEFPDELIGAFWILQQDSQKPTGKNIMISEGYTVAITDSLKEYSRVFLP